MKVEQMAKKIMIVDDEPDIQLYLHTALEDAGYKVCLLEEHQDFLQAIKSERPDLVCLDIMMPQQSGVSMYTQLKQSEEFREIPIIVITGMAPVKDFIGDGFRKLTKDESMPLPEVLLEKPVQIPQLLEIVADLLAEEAKDGAS